MTDIRTKLLEIARNAKPADPLGRPRILYETEIGLNIIPDNDRVVIMLKAEDMEVHFDLTEDYCLAECRTETKEEFESDDRPDNVTPGDPA